MKKAAALILLFSVSFALFSCSNGAEPVCGKSGFASSSVIFDELDKAISDFLSAVNLPSSDSSLSGRIEWIKDDAEEQNTVYPNAVIYGGYIKETGAFEAKIETTGGSIGIFSDEKGMIVGKSQIKMQKLSDIFEKYLKVFCDSTDESDYKTLPDNIRVSDIDEEVSRITLTLDKERAQKAVQNTLNAFKEDAGSYNYICGLLSLYSECYMLDENGQQLLDGFLQKAADGINGDFIWERYVYCGKTVAENLKIGDGGERFNAHYACTVSKSETELKLIVKNGSETLCDAYYLFRKSDISDTYRFQLVCGARVINFNGEVKTALKSGSADLQFYATENSDPVTHANLYLSYNGIGRLKYTGSGYIGSGERKCRFTLSLGFTGGDPGNIEKPAVMVYTDNFYSLYSKLRSSFPDVWEYLKGADQK